MLRWHNSLRTHGSADWVIIVVESNDTKKKNKTNILPRSSIVDKIRSDFCNKQNDRSEEELNECDASGGDGTSAAVTFNRCNVDCPLFQVCCAVRPSEGLVPVTRVLELLAAEIANPPPHVLHEEPGPL